MGHLSWYVARAAGIVAWALVTASVLWGLAMTTRLVGRRDHPGWMVDLHRYLGGLATVFTALHVAAVVADDYVHFTRWAVLVPLAGTWRPGAVAWGIVGMYLLAAVELTSLARSRLPRRAWRAVHLAAFPLFVVATLHGFTAGTDARSPLARILLAATVSAVAGLAWVRASSVREPGNSPYHVQGGRTRTDEREAVPAART